LFAVVNLLKYVVTEV